jgi:hypothetical protein
MFPRKLIKPIALVAAAIAVGGGAYEHHRRNRRQRLWHRDNNSLVLLGNLSATPRRPRWIQRSVRTGCRRNNRHG